MLRVKSHSHGLRHLKKKRNNRIFGSGKTKLVGIIENNKFDVILGQVRLCKG